MGNRIGVYDVRMELKRRSATRGRSIGWGAGLGVYNVRIKSMYCGWQQGVGVLDGG
jgi:hypothetical protein